MLLNTKLPGMTDWYNRVLEKLYDNRKLNSCLEEVERLQGPDEAVQSNTERIDQEGTQVHSIYKELKRSAARSSRVEFSSLRRQLSSGLGGSKCTNLSCGLNSRRFETGATCGERCNAVEYTNL